MLFFNSIDFSPVIIIYYNCSQRMAWSILLCAEYQKSPQFVFTYLLHEVFDLGADAQS